MTGAGDERPTAANPVRGEATILIGGVPLLLRPSFEALVGAEDELGSLFALIERAATDGLKVQEIAALFWHCLAARPEGLTRERLSAALIEKGLAAAMPALRTLLRQVLQGG